MASVVRTRVSAKNNTSGVVGQRRAYSSQGEHEGLKDASEESEAGEGQFLD